MMCGTSSPMNRITDLQGYNLYFGWYMQTYHAIDQWLDNFHAEYPDIKLCLSEYGAEGVLQYQTDQGVQGDYSESYQARFHEHYARAISERDWLWGSYVWNMFDFGAANRNEGGVKGRNNKGLVTIDRKIRKDAFMFIRRSGPMSRLYISVGNGISTGSSVKQPFLFTAISRRLH